jgi:hypothetical protein
MRTRGNCNEHSLGDRLEISAKMARALDDQNALLGWLDADMAKYFDRTAYCPLING